MTTAIPSLIHSPEVELNQNKLSIWSDSYGWEVSYPTDQLASNAYHWLSLRLHTFALKPDGFYLYGVPVYSYDQLIARFIETCKSAGLTVATVKRGEKEN